MTGSTIVDARVASSPSTFGRLAGLGPLFRKDTTEWLRGRRAWIVLAISVVFMTLSAANGWIVARIAEADPNYAPGDYAPTSLVPLDNLLVAVGSQIFVVAAIFAVSSLLVGERQSGTLAWVASKPVARASIWASKWLSASAILAVTAGIVPLALTTGVVGLLYGMPPIAAVVGLAVGIAAVVAFFAAVGLAAGTVMPGQAAIAATGFGVFALTPVLVALVPFPIEPFMPTSMLAWAGGFATGADVGFVTPIAWAVVIGGLVAVSLRRMSRIEL